MKVFTDMLAMATTIDFVSVLFNVLGIIGLICLGTFIIVVLADLLISIIDGSNGIFFKRKKSDGEQERYEEPVRQPKMLQEPERVVEIKEEKPLEEQLEELSNEGKVDFAKAEEEERELRSKLALNNNGTMEEEEDKQPTQEEVKDQLAKFFEEEEDEDLFENEDEEDEDYFDEYKDIIDEITNTSIEEEAEGIADVDVDEVVFEEPVDQEIEVQLPTLEEIKEEVEEDVTEQERMELEAEIARLKEELEKGRKELEETRKEAMYKTAMLEGEKEKLAEELRLAKEEQAAAAAVKVEPGLLSEEEYVTRIEMLRERLRENEKQLRANKKEFKPLERVSKTLERDRQKLRRREAIVAKQKVMLYGVNNYVDIDEEKAKKLTEDLDLLDGLRLSVQHCEEVMEANKDRYPILEQTYRILSETNKQITEDLQEAEEGLRKLQEAKKDEE